VAEKGKGGSGRKGNDKRRSRRCLLEVGLEPGWPIEGEKSFDKRKKMEKEKRGSEIETNWRRNRAKAEENKGMKEPIS